MSQEKFGFHAMPHFHDGSTYERALELAVEEKDWALVSRLQETKDVTKWTSEVCKVFRTAIAQGADAYASTVAKILLRAAVDGVVHQHIVMKAPQFQRAKRPHVQALQEGFDEKRLEIEVLEDDAHRALASLAEKLFFDELPTKGKQERVVQVDVDIRETETYDTPVFLETKQVLLVAIAQRWAATGDEEEADKLFDFLRNQAPQFEEERRAWVRILKDALSSSFPPSRLVRHLLSIIPNVNKGLIDGWDGTLATELARAWGRLQSAPYRIAQDRRVMEPVSNSSMGAHALLASFSQELAEFDTKLRNLVEWMQTGVPEGFKKRSWSMSPYDYKKNVSGKISFVYQSVLLDRVGLSIVVETVDKRSEEHVLQMTLNRATGIIAEWKQKFGFSAKKIDVEVWFHGRFSPEHKTLKYSVTV